VVHQEMSREGSDRLAVPEASLSKAPGVDRIDPEVALPERQKGHFTGVHREDQIAVAGKV